MLKNVAHATSSAILVTFYASNGSHPGTTQRAPFVVGEET